MLDRSVTMPHRQLRVTPHGRLLFENAEDAPTLDEPLAMRLADAFGRGAGYGLLRLGAGEIGEPLPPAFVWWRDFAARYVSAICLHTPSATGEETPPSSTQPAIPPPTEAELATLALTAPMMPGAEYVNPEVLLSLWTELGTAFAESLAECNTDLQSFLKTLNAAWNLIGRVHFNLAENRRDSDFPFAFMATYTTQLTPQAKPKHVPLGQALREYAGAANRDRLLSLLLPVQRAAERCCWLRSMVDRGEIFHPLRWSASEAALFLNSVSDLESAGVVVRMPANWRLGRPPRPKVTATVGIAPPLGPGLDALLDFQMEMTLEGEPLSEEEMTNLLAGTESLVLLRGQWVEIDRPRLERAMRRFSEAQNLAEREGMTFTEAMRLLAGVAVAGDEEQATIAEWSHVSAGPWLAETLKKLRDPDGAAVDPGRALNGSLRPYQKAGVEWLHLLSGLGFGACLADDMGLGKTIQVLALLLIRKEKNNDRKPSSSAMTAEDLKNLAKDGLSDVDLAIASYDSLLRMPVLGETSWRFVVLDEAQAIKNPSAKQTRAAKALKADARIALTGTPVENHLGDLWSIFDFINPGLLGSAKEFGRYTKALVERPHNPYGPLRDLVRPYILRRMKTDKTVIADLPEKTEVKAYCSLSRKQAALYAQTVAELSEALQDAEGIKRKGIVLATLMRLKQICNHPSHWLNDNEWAETDSGKWARLREIAGVVATRQEKMLVFTQFREMTAPLHAYLGWIFGRPGLILHGGTAVKNRKALVQTFQEDETVPFFVLSLKAGGSGLNLTAASHVVHFDRWWNPAVENQATDRAFRIGQKKNVLVHKFVCQGTIEEKIDDLIEAKKELSEDVLAGGDEINLTEMKDEDLIQLMTLDLNLAMAE
jgi:non-specific serine/threonine protein kinase